jgi:hypothetical protein
MIYVSLTLMEQQEARISDVCVIGVCIYREVPIRLARAQNGLCPSLGLEIQAVRAGVSLLIDNRQHEGLFLDDILATLASLPATA